jgi:hypothetical protein
VDASFGNLRAPARVAFEDVERARFPLERELNNVLARTVPPEGLEDRALGLVRTVEQGSVLLRQVRDILGIEIPLDLAPRENAPRSVRDPGDEVAIRVELPWKLAGRIDPVISRALVGHELGHHLDSQATSCRHLRPWDGYASWVQATGRTSSQTLECARVHLLACEITADRVALVAAQDLQATVHAQHMLLTGLPAPLASDVQSIIEQSRRLARRVLADDVSSLSERALRIYALSRFSETRDYRLLANIANDGPELAEVDEELEGLARRPHAEVALEGGAGRAEVGQGSADRPFVEQSRDGSDAKVAALSPTELESRFQELERRYGYRS